MEMADNREYHFIFRNAKEKCELIRIPKDQEHRFIIGRYKIDCLKDYPTVSPHHAILRNIDNEWFIEDDISKTGVYVNRKKIKSEKRKITVGDIITLSVTHPTDNNYFDLLFSSRNREELHEHLMSSDSESEDLHLNADSSDDNQNPSDPLSFEQDEIITSLGKNKYINIPSLKEIYRNVKNISDKDKSPNFSHPSARIKNLPQNNNMDFRRNFPLKENSSQISIHSDNLPSCSWNSSTQFKSPSKIEKTKYQQSKEDNFNEQELNMITLNDLNLKRIKSEKQELVDSLTDEQANGNKKHQSLSNQTYSIEDEVIVISDDDENFSSQDHFFSYIKKEPEDISSDYLPDIAPARSYQDFMSQPDDLMTHSSSEITEDELKKEFNCFDDDEENLSHSDDQHQESFQTEVDPPLGSTEDVTTERNGSSFHTNSINKSKKARRKVCYTDPLPMTYKPKCSRGRSELLEEEGNRNYSEKKVSKPHPPYYLAKKNQIDDKSQKSPPKISNSGKYNLNSDSPKKRGKRSVREKVRKQYKNRIPIPGGGNAIRMTDNEKKNDLGQRAMNTTPTKNKVSSPQKYLQENLAGNKMPHFERDTNVNLNSLDRRSSNNSGKRKRKNEEPLDCFQGINGNKQKVNYLGDDNTLKNFKIPKKPKVVVRNLEDPGTSQELDPQNRPNAPGIQTIPSLNAKKDQMKTNVAHKVSLDAQFQSNSNFSSEKANVSSDKTRSLVSNQSPGKKILKINPNNANFDLDSLLQSNLHNGQENDMSYLSPTSTSVHNNTPKIDEIKIVMFHWNVGWLREQNLNNKPPPLLHDCQFLAEKNYENFKVKLSYSSYEDYFKTYISLMLYETWELIRNSVSDAEPIVRCDIRQIRSYNFFNTFVCCSSRITNFEKKFDLKEKDLVLVDVYVKNGRIRIFGLVSKCQVNIARNSHGVPEENMQLEIQTKLTKDDIDRNKRLSIRKIVSLNSKLLQFESILELHKSKLLNFILKPSEDICKISDCSNMIRLLSSKYNNKQNSAINGITQSVFESEEEPKIMLLQGPPGSGKTHTIIGLTEKLNFKCEEKKVLILAPTDVAIEQICKRFLEFNSEPFLRRNIDFVLIAEKKQIHYSLQKYCLEVNVPNFGKSNTQYSNDTYQSNDENLKTKQLEQLTKANVVLSTLNGSHRSVLGTPLSRGQIKFSCCIVDEAASCTEPELLLAFCYNIKKFVLVGDHIQLPAPVLSKSAMECNFQMSLFERFSTFFKENFNRTPAIVLSNQYRMNSEIAMYPSLFYDGKLFTDRTLRSSWFPLKPCVLLDLEDVLQLSKYMNMEVPFISKLIDDVVELTSDEDSIGIIAMSSDICNSLKQELPHVESRIEINTMDKYQGRQKDVVIFSCFFSRETNYQDFGKKLNFAITRAKHSLIICGHLDSLFTNIAWSPLIQNACTRGVINRFTKDKWYNLKEFIRK